MAQYVVVDGKKYLIAVPATVPTLPAAPAHFAELAAAADNRSADAELLAAAAE